MFDSVCRLLLSAIVVATGPCDAEQNPTERTRVVDLLEETMAEQVSSGFWGVVYVAQGGKILLHQGYGMADRKTGQPMTRDTIISAGSLSKQVTAAAALKLVADGKLSLDDTIGMHFPEVPEDKAGITIEQLLSHSGGIAPWVYKDDYTQIPLDVWLEKVFSTPLAKKPGSEYLYANDGITLAAIIVQRVAGTSFRQYLREQFFDPLGMDETGWFDDERFDDPDLVVATGYRGDRDVGAPNEWGSPSWALLGNGGILWTAEDMATWHEAVHGELLPALLRERLFRPVIEDPERDLYPSETEPMYYGLGWRIGTSLCGDTRIGHTGSGIAHNVDYRYYRDRDILIYAASNKIGTHYSGAETFYARQAAEALSRVFMQHCD